MHKLNDPMFLHYSLGDWITCSTLLETQIFRYAGEGDEVQLARTLSYYGVVNLFLANYDIVATIYKQVYSEYQRGPDDLRIAACYSRFLALYHVFVDKSDLASHFYDESFRYYEELDWHMDEALMIQESLCWFYLFNDHYFMQYKGMERLRKLNQRLGGVFDKELEMLQDLAQFLREMRKSPSMAIDLNFENGIVAGNRNRHIRILSDIVICLTKLVYFVQANQAPVIDNTHVLHHGWEKIKGSNDMSGPLEEIHADLLSLLKGFARNVDDIRETLERSAAKIGLFRHPWYKACIELIHASFLEANSDSLLSKFNEKQKQERASIQLNDECEKTESKAEKANTLTIHLFGELRIQQGLLQLGESDIGTRQLRELLTYVLLHPKWQISKEWLMDEFYQDEHLAKLSNRLYVTIHRINRSLQMKLQLPRDLQILSLQHGTVRLNQDLIEEVDVQNYRKLISVANQLWLHNKEASAELMEKACRIYSNELVPELLYVDWLDRYRDEFRFMQINALGKLMSYYREKKDDAAFEEAFQKLFKMDPLNENAYSHYIQFLKEKNRDAEAYQWHQKVNKELEISR